MPDNPFVLDSDPKLELTHIGPIVWENDDAVSIDISVGYLMPDPDAPKPKAETEWEAEILKDARQLFPQKLTEFRIDFSEVLRLDVFDTESRNMGKNDGPLENFTGLNSSVPGVAVARESNYLEQTRQIGWSCEDVEDVYHTHITSFGSCVVNILSWAEPTVREIGAR